MSLGDRENRLSIKTEILKEILRFEEVYASHDEHTQKTIEQTNNGYITGLEIALGIIDKIQNEEDHNLRQEIKDLRLKRNIQAIRRD